MFRIIILIALSAWAIALKAQVPAVSCDSLSMMIDGKRVIPVMGEMHYMRVPADDWASEIHKMKQGGVNIVSTYVFWNYVEEERGKFDWSGQQDFHRFLEVCKQEGVAVFLRIGPFVHGEVRNGGFPEWLATGGLQLRTETNLFLKFTEAFFRQVYAQAEGMLWKDGGPIIGVQIENEYWGPVSYLLKLKKMVREIGFDVPLYTRTIWPDLSEKVPYGELIPLYCCYADGFWNRSFEEATSSFWASFHFRPRRTDDQYPYFTCEMSGGMIGSYHRRLCIYPEDIYSLALVNLGSECNLLGYYMYHGGTNPDGKFTYMNETQKVPYMNYNDMPVKSYEFQAPLGEFGQMNPHYFMLRKLHFFTNDFGDVLAPMTSEYPKDAICKMAEDTRLRWCYRHDGDRAFVFVNNYERLQKLTAKDSVQFDVCGVTFPQEPMTIPDSCMAIFPVNIQLGDVDVKYATAQLMAKRERPDGRTAYYFFKVDSVNAEFCVNGKVMMKVKPKKRPIYSAGKTDIYLISEKDAELFELDFKLPKASKPVNVSYTKVKENSGPRKITFGAQKVTEEPEDSDFEKAAVYSIDLSSIKDIDKGRKLLDIDYHGDVARLYADGKLIDDNFYNGRHFQYALWLLPKDCKSLELRILPIQENMPVFYPREADHSPGESVNSITVSDSYIISGR